MFGPIDDPVISEIPEPAIPYGYLILFRFTGIFLFIVTLGVWAMAWQMVARLRTGMWIPMDDFARTMMGYHILLLIVSIIGVMMRKALRKYGTLSLYPLVIVLGTLSVLMAAAQLLVMYLAV